MKRADGTFDMELWEGQQAARAGLAPDDKRVALRFGDGDKWRSYVYRMLPHYFGIFPYAFAWYPIIDSFFQQIDDLCERLQDLMPSWVPFVIVGCFAIFSCFTFVQWRCASAAPAGGAKLRAHAPCAASQVPVDGPQALLAHRDLVLSPFGAHSCQDAIRGLHADAARGFAGHVQVVSRPHALHQRDQPVVFQRRGCSGQQHRNHEL